MDGERTIGSSAEFPREPDSLGQADRTFEEDTQEGPHHGSRAVSQHEARTAVLNLVLFAWWNLVPSP